MSQRNGSATASEAAEEVSASQVVLGRSAIRSLRAEEAMVDRSAVGVARIDHGTLRQSQAGIVAGKSVACDEVRTFVLAAPVVRGEVHTLFDLRTAVAIGFGMALGKVFVEILRAGGRKLLA